MEAIGGVGAGRVSTQQLDMLERRALPVGGGLGS
jgi:hypothetical protein